MEHWLFFQRARGGDVYLHSGEGEKVELDERPFSEALAEQTKFIDRSMPLIEVLGSVSDWFNKMEITQARTALVEPAERGHGILTRVTEGAQLALGCTLYILQEREGQA